MLKTAVGAWLSDFDIRLVLERRALMERKIYALIEAWGEETVFIDNECRSGPKFLACPARARQKVSRDRQGPRHTRVSVGETYRHSERRP